MHRIDSPGSTINNLFTEGNPSLSIPATEVSDDWLNDVQEEIANLIENQGIALVKGQQDQLEAAIDVKIGLGGGQIKLDPLENNTLAQDITGLIFNKVSVKAAIIYYDVHRETDTSNVQEVGVLAVTHDSKDDVWRGTKLINGLDNAGTIFKVSNAGQVSVDTDDLTGANYAGQVRITGVTKFSL